MAKIEFDLKSLEDNFNVTYDSLVQELDELKVSIREAANLQAITMLVAAGSTPEKAIAKVREITKAMDKSLL